MAAEGQPVGRFIVRRIFKDRVLLEDTHRKTRADLCRIVEIPLGNTILRQR
jgi:hypothetical protein